MDLSFLMKWGAIAGDRGEAKGVGGGGFCGGGGGGRAKKGCWPCGCCSLKKHDEIRRIMKVISLLERINGRPLSYNSHSPLLHITCYTHHRNARCYSEPRALPERWYYSFFSRTFTAQHSRPTLTATVME